MLESILLAASIASAPCGYDGPVYAQGVARDADSGHLAYCEYHLPQTDDRRRVLYYSPQGHRIADKQVLGVNSPVPEILQQDFRHGEQREVRRVRGDWRLAYRARSESAQQMEQLAAGAVDVIDAGFDVFVRENWQSLASGQGVSFEFASPLHGRAIKLRARRAPCVPSDPALLCVRVDLAQPLLRLFAGELQLVYERSGRRLRSFTGVSNLLDADGRSQSVRIDYSYPR